MSKNLNERQEKILKELRAFIENCTTYSGSVNNYTDFKRINICINQVAKSDQEVSILDLCDIENSIDYYIRCSHMISQMDEIKSFKARGFVVEDIIDLYVNGINPRCLGYVVEAGQIRTQFNSFTFRDPVPKDMLTNDYMNTKRRPWQQVRNEYFETNVSLEQMFDKITPIAQKMIKDYMASARSDYPLTRKAFLINANGVKTK